MKLTIKDKPTEVLFTEMQVGTRYILKDYDGNLYTKASETSTIRMRDGHSLMIFNTRDICTPVRILSVEVERL